MNKIKTLTENKILRISIDESWSSNDFIYLFASLNFLYKILIDLNEIDDTIKFYKKLQKENKKENKNLKFENEGFEFRTFDDIEIVNGQLYKRLNYSSTSNNSELITDYRQQFTKEFLNNDRIYRRVFQVAQIKYSSPGFVDLMGLGKIIEQIFDLIKHYFPNRETKIKNNLLEQDLISKKIENLKSFGFTDNELRKLLDIRNSSILNIKNLKLSDKLTKVEIKDIE